MDNDKSLRDQLVKLLDSDQAHLKFDDAVKDFPPALRGVRPAGGPHSAWELLEHLRLAQWDNLDFTRDPRHFSPAFPDGYCPSASPPPPRTAWYERIAALPAPLTAFPTLQPY